MKFLFLLLCLLSDLALGFGLQSNPEFYTVDTGAGLTFSVRRTDRGSSTQSIGDIASLRYQGVEYQNPQRGSQVNAGFDWLYQNLSAVSISAQQLGSDIIKITVEAGPLTHYYLVRRNQPYIYMATYFTEEPSVHGHVRYIMRLRSDLLPAGSPAADLRGNIGAIEAKDIFALPNGETRSKHYSNMRLRDWQFFGATGRGVGMWFVRDRHEGGSGGPFYRSLLNQVTDTDQELTYIVNYGEAQTEAFRTHILNSYTFVVTDGRQPPKAIDTSWFKDANLKGYVPSSQRGRVTGVGVRNIDPEAIYTFGLANARAQYWATGDRASAHFNLPDVLPGDYALTVYKNELAVQQANVRVQAGRTTILNSLSADDPEAAPSIWRIGRWDGMPREFLNGPLLTAMHPSDARMASWTPGPYTIGDSTTQDFPAYIWKDVNNSQVVLFKLDKSSLQKALTLRIGITCTTSNARPVIRVNGWSSGIPTPTTQPKTRTLTVGTYRCQNATHRFVIPASAWQKDADDLNQLTIAIASGSGAGSFLSAGLSFDAIDLIDSP